MSTPGFDQLSSIGQKVIAAAAESSMDSRLGALSQAGDGGSLGSRVLYQHLPLNDRVQLHILATYPDTEVLRACSRYSVSCWTRYRFL
jgi:hypothetical protein